jgi:hypothetical protein
MLQRQNQHLLDQGGYKRKKYTGNKHECLDSRFLYFLGLQYDATNKIDVFRMISILILILTIFRDHVIDQLPGLISCSVKPSSTLGTNPEKSRGWVGALRVRSSPIHDIRFKFFASQLCPKIVLSGVSHYFMIVVIILTALILNLQSGLS